MERPTSRPRPTPTPELNVIGSGSYIVGSEIRPGRYRVAGYCAILDEQLDSVENDLVDADEGVGFLDVKASYDYVEICGEAAPLSELPKLDPVAIGLTSGSYLVGADIQLGRYPVTAIGNGSAYATRLACDYDIIDNDRSDGSVIASSHLQAHSQDSEKMS